MMPPLNTIAFLVENKAGVLFNVSNMFRRRGFNIESISVGPVEGHQISRMTVSVYANNKELNQIVLQLEKMVDIIKVKRLDKMRSIMREMVLIKVDTVDPMAREETLRHVNAYHGLILHIDAESIIAEVTGESEVIDEFISKTRPIGIEELSRTGVTALEKGNLKL
ncbi:acetolactate synthase small subunit [Candidatus Bathyarchaeota archaeon]|jgi:acetolactate synthase-1/3 small subunit|nr:acetolactate synthase small subunit [Candidatus Bathyarchaeota archaeon]MDP6458313.1 acetolactate synthase small subunit [Candidatus Bathyarchaeota archaeon]MDP7442864.1 acetolactate synthase small subunit [Candidatus Bathyarchaeota archaeon]|tara:strand:+ start:619 stop:1116 length:498 start_codon:yes stop_codon:yes gene_type:complete